MADGNRGQGVLPLTHGRNSRPGHAPANPGGFLLALALSVAARFAIGLQEGGKKQAPI